MIRNLTHTLNVDILRMVYFVYFQPILQYGIILGVNSTHAQQIFKLQNRVNRIMSGMAPRESYRNLYKKLNILPVPCQYMLPLMLFVIENQQDLLITHMCTVWTLQIKIICICLPLVLLVCKGEYCTQGQKFLTVSQTTYRNIKGKG